MASRERITRAEFRREVIALLHAAGLEGPFTHDEEGDRLVHAGEGSFDLREAYDNMAGLPAAQRADLLGRAIRGLVKAPSIPTTWAEARDLVRLSVTPRISVVAAEIRRSRGSTEGATPQAELTPHLVLQLVLPQTKTRQATVSMDLVAHWGVPVEEAFRTATENLRRVSNTGWGLMKEAPGVYFSPWKDGFDASRVTLPRLFAGVPLRGRPVALAPSPSAFAFAGSDDEEGLFHLARLSRRLYEQSKTYLFLRPIRLAEDGESWEPWLPERGHGACEPLRLLHAINECGDYAEHAAIVRRAAESKGAVMRMPALEIVQSLVGAETMTVTRWKAGGTCALPRADAIILERDDGEVLGWARWDAVAKPLRLRALPGYPTRYLATTFPEDWQLGSLDLQPWTPPQS